MALSRYTSTYTDVAGNIADADDLIDEFDRISEFMAAWVVSYESIGISDVDVNNGEIVDGDVDIDPDGMIQRRIIEEDVTTVNVNFAKRLEGNAYRVYVILRFRGKATTFTVSGPAGSTHIFGVNRSPYTPCQVEADGHYVATVIATYTDAGGVFINVFADNAEDTTLDGNDVLTSGAV